MATLNIKNLPDPLYKKLQARAKREHRSLSQEVVHLLTESTREPETLSLLRLRGLGKEIWAGEDATRYVECERDSWDR